MNRSLSLLLVVTLAGGSIQAQNIGINVDGAVPAASSLLDIDALALPANDKRGLLIPRIALTSRTVAAPVVAPAASLVIYNTATAGAAPNNVAPGFYYWNGATEWLRMFSGNDAWSTTGNFGTTAGTNFIGTTDAKDFVVKTGGSAAANERMRVLSGGPIVVNKTTAAATDAFSVYGTGSTGAINALGTNAISGYTATGRGVFGISTSTTTTGDLTGVWGEAASTLGTGVVGLASGTSGQADGVFGQTASTSGNGMFGANAATTGVGVAVRGQSVTRNGVAILGIVNTSNANITAGTTAYGVQGQVNGAITGTGQAIGVFGVTAMTTGAANGVWGQSASTTGNGVLGFSTNTTAAGTGTGVWGEAASGIGTGARGRATYTGGGVVQPVGVFGDATHANGFGSYGKNRHLSGTGVSAVGNNEVGNYLVAGSGIAASGNTTGALHYYTNAGASWGTVIQDAFANQWNVGGWNGFGYFKIIGPGAVSTVVKDMEDQKVLLYCPEAPEVLFQDYGIGQLTDGSAHVQIDPILTKNIIVSEDHPLKVFVQVEGDCHGVYVTNKSATGFDVHELSGGTSSVAFSWSIVATRADETEESGNGDVRHSSYRQRFGPAPPYLERRAMLPDQTGHSPETAPQLMKQPLTKEIE